MVRYTDRRAPSAARPESGPPPVLAMKQPAAPLSDQTRILSVTQLNAVVRTTLESALEPLWVVGEVSNVRTPPSGHLYFTLKDDQSQIAAVMFRRYGQALDFRIEDGMEVLCLGRVSVYTVRGDLQFYAVELEPRGKGALTLAFEQLKRRLYQEGLFDPQFKKALPVLPRTIGLVTSLRGAAVRDMLKIIGARFAERRVIIRPVRVQGEGAAAEIAEGIRDLDTLGFLDVMIVGRGGGSLEDLWAFNEEVVARAIFAARTPVVSAVGHEIDVTIADFVADERAPTPTAAAEMAVPRKDDLSAMIAALDARMRRALQGDLKTRKEGLRHLVRRLVDPTRRLRDNQMRLDELSVRLYRRHENWMQRARERIVHLTSRLNGLSPLAVLGRGYSIVYRLPDQKIVKDASDLHAGGDVRVEFARGRAVCRVEEVE